ncbi:hypothetical protein GCM10022222_07940 [Amycolatopsis ultiminotia]|uniref:Transposase n=1 Tax=Amycolatopsis ultiminotia TaxID=543629 RepID=A0ABP6V5V5_9PSEU
MLDPHGRLIVDAIFSVTDNGIKRRALPADFPAPDTDAAPGTTNAPLHSLRPLGHDQNPEPTTHPIS